MAYYYVKSGGTAAAATDNGRYASQQTGTFATIGASGYYASLQDAVDATTAPAYGDFICISDASALNTSTPFAYDNAPTGGGSGVNIVCVDDSNCENAAVASSALETISGGTGDLWLSSVTDSVVNVYGVWLTSEDNLSIARSSGMTVCANSTFEVTGNDDVIYFGGTTGTGSSVTLIDCTLKFGDANSELGLQYGVNLLMIGGSFDGGGVKTDFMDNSTAAGSGARALFYGVDLSDATDSLINNAGTGANKDQLRVEFRKCQIASSTEIFDSALGMKWGQVVLASNCAHDSTAEWQFYWREEDCEAEATSSTYRDQSVAFPVTGSKISIAVDTATSGNASIIRPFTFDLPSRYAALSSTSTDLITIYLSGPSGLTDADIWAVAIYPDGTNAHVANHEVSSSLTDYADAFDPFRTGTALTADTGSSWTSGGVSNYRIEIDTSGDAGTDSVPIIRVFVSDLASTVWIDSQVDLS